MFTPPHQEAGSTILYILEPLKPLARDPNEKGIAVTEPGGDKGIDRLFCILEGEKGTGLGNISQRMPTFQVFPTTLLKFLHLCLWHLDQLGQNRSVLFGMVLWDREFSKVVVRLNSKLMDKRQFDWKHF